MNNLYHGMGQATLDAAYNNRQAVADSVAILANFQRRSDALRARYPKHWPLRTAR